MSISHIIDTKNNLVTLDKLLSLCNINIMLHNITQYFKKYFAYSDGHSLYKTQKNSTNYTGKFISNKKLNELETGKDVAFLHANNEFINLLKIVVEKMT